MLPRKWALTVECLIQRHAKAELVAPRVGSLSLVVIGRHIARSGNDSARMRQGAMEGESCNNALGFVRWSRVCDVFGGRSATGQAKVGHPRSGQVGHRRID